MKMFTKMRLTFVVSLASSLVFAQDIQDTPPPPMPPPPPGLPIDGAASVVLVLGLLFGVYAILKKKIVFN
ncbi:MAG: hypothetical protein ACWA5P_09840 [bacterium]